MNKLIDLARCEPAPTQDAKQAILDYLNGKIAQGWKSSGMTHSTVDGQLASLDWSGYLPGGSVLYVLQAVTSSDG